MLYSSELKERIISIKNEINKEFDRRSLLNDKINFNRVLNNNDQVDHEFINKSMDALLKITDIGDKLKSEDPNNTLATLNNVENMEEAINNLKKEKVNDTYTNCRSSCMGMCYGTCNNTCNGCTGTCSGGCSSGCSSGCSGTCAVGCGNTCSSLCSNSCKDTCQGSCVGSCQGHCTTNCTSGCVGTCMSICQGTCSNTCEGTCNNQCTSCSNECQGTCSNTCSGGCAWSCGGNGCSVCTGSGSGFWGRDPGFINNGPGVLSPPTGNGPIHRTGPATGRYTVPRN